MPARGMFAYLFCGFVFVFSLIEVELVGESINDADNNILYYAAVDMINRSNGVMRARWTLDSIIICIVLFFPLQSF